MKIPYIPCPTRITKSPTGGPPLRVRAVDVRGLEPDSLAAWHDLELRSLEPNVFLSPHFVLPALRHLDPELKAIALFVEALSSSGDPSESRLVGLLVGHVAAGTRTFPVPHFVAYKSRHSYLTGMLLDRERAQDALTALLDFMRAQSPWCHGVQWNESWADGPTFDLLLSVCERMGMAHHRWEIVNRAVLFPQWDRERIQAAVASGMHEQRRRIRRLGEMGEVQWSLVGCSPGQSDVIDVFLDLEHQGWKREGGSSMRSTAAGEAFFRCLAAGLGAQGRALFSQLSLCGRVIASTVNFLSGRGGFAFKIGWLPEFRPLAPGIQDELRLMSVLLSEKRLADIDFWDSGAGEGSYIEKLWPSRRPLASFAVGTSWLGRQALDGIRGARIARRVWRDCLTVRTWLLAPLSLIFDEGGALSALLCLAGA